MLRDDLVLEQPTNKFMKLAYYLFNWATIQSYKWKFNRGYPPDVRTPAMVVMIVDVGVTMML